MWIGIRKKISGFWITGSYLPKNWLILDYKFLDDNHEEKYREEEHPYLLVVNPNLPQGKK